MSLGLFDADMVIQSWVAEASGRSKTKILPITEVKAALCKSGLRNLNETSARLKNGYLKSCLEMAHISRRTSKEDFGNSHLNLAQQQGVEGQEGRSMAL